MAYAEVSGRRVYYELHGDLKVSARTPLVLVMGVAGSCKGWLPLQVPEFSGSRPVLIYDHRGVGQSDDVEKPFTTASLADDTAQLLDTLDFEKADVLGVFMGGMIAQELALNHPDRVDRLVLVGTYARPDAKRRMLLQHWIHMNRNGIPRDIMTYNRLLWTLQDETLEQTDLIEAMTDFFTRDDQPISSDVFIRQCEACIAHDTLDRLSAMENRALILCGRHDLLTPPKFHRELADLIPNAQLVTMGYGGHLIMVESAVSFNQIVLQFLEDER